MHAWKLNTLVSLHYDVVLINVYILVKTSNRTLYIHEYNGVYGSRFQCLVPLEQINQEF